jgi:hypothetical protein
MSCIEEEDVIKADFILQSVIFESPVIRWNVVVKEN